MGGVNRFYQRQLRNQYVPTTMAEMAAMPESRLRAQAQAYTTIDQLQPLFNVRNADLEQANQSINQFQGGVDELVSKINQSGAVAPGIQDELSNLTKQYRDFNSKGGKWSKYQQSYDEYQGEIEKYDKLIESDKKNASWWSRLKADFQESNQHSSFDEQGTYRGISPHPITEYVSAGDDLLKMFGDVDLDKLSYENPEWGPKLASMGFTPQPGANGTLEYRDQDKMLALAFEYSQRPDVQAYYKTIDRLEKGQTPTGFDQDNPWIIQDKDGNMVPNPNTLYGQAVATSIYAKSPIRDNMSFKDNTTKNGANSHSLANGSNVLIVPSLLPPVENEVSAYGSLGQLVETHKTMVQEADASYKEQLASTAALLGLNNSNPNYLDQTEALLETANANVIETKEGIPSLSSEFLQDLAATGKFTTAEIGAISK